MFAGIADRYDLLNRVLSAGTDQRWRRALLRAAGKVEGSVLVDVCCGTGDVALLFAREGARVLGVDFTPEMLQNARAKWRPFAGPHAGPHARPGAGTCVFVQGDALALPLADRSADIATIAFGIRNVADRAQGLCELARVVRRGGLVLVLEFSLPPGRVLGSAYRLYFTRVLPWIGGWVSGNPAAYRYLPDTVMTWPTPEAFEREMSEAGLEACEHRLLSGGIAALFWGRVPGSENRR